MKKYLYTTLVASIIVVATPFIAHAVTQPAAPATGSAGSGQALEIAPPVVNLRGDPGQKITAQISLRDISSSPLVVSASVDDFTANGEDGIPKILLNEAEPTPYSIKSWIAPINQMTLKSKEIQKLPINISIPKNAAPGGYYGIIRFTASAPDMKETGVSLSASLGALIFLRVNGTANQSLAVESFQTVGSKSTPTALFESAPITFAVRAKNTGNVFEKPTGQIAVSDMFGNKIANVNVNLDQRAILPGTIRKFEPQLDKTNIGDRVLFGLYNAKLTLKFADDKTVTSSLSFWVIPWKIVLIGIAILAGLAIAARYILKRHTARVLQRSRKSTRR